MSICPPRRAWREAAPPSPCRMEGIVVRFARPVRRLSAPGCLPCPRECAHNPAARARRASPLAAMILQCRMVPGNQSASLPSRSRPRQNPGDEHGERGIQETSGEHRRTSHGGRLGEAGPPRGRQPSDREGRRRRAGAGLHRGHAGLEDATSGAASTRSSRAPCPDVRKAVRWNSPFYGVEGQGWFLSFHCFTKYVKVTFFRGASLRPLPPGESKDEERALPRHPRGRRARRGAVGGLDPAGGRVCPAGSRSPAPTGIAHLLATILLCRGRPACLPRARTSPTPYAAWTEAGDLLY